MKHLKSILIVIFFTLSLYQVKGQPDIHAVVDAIQIPNTDAVKSHLYLPVLGQDGVTHLQWASSDSSIVYPGYQPGYNDSVLTPPGVVSRQATDTKITLTVTATNGSETATKSFDITVLGQPQTTDYVAYLYAYFSAVSGVDEVQQVHFAISEDGLHWKDLNEHQPVLTSVLGDKGVRDPYIMRSPEGDHFFLVATDLDIYHSKYHNDWGLMSTKGSTALMIWESDDLVNWSPQRMVDVSSDIGAGNTWAPEGIFDETTNEFLVYWSSRTPNDNFNRHRIWLAKTRDFIHFTSPQVFVEEPNAVIDASILKTKGAYYMLIKNESNRSVKLKSANKLLDYENSRGLGNSFVRLKNNGIEKYTGGYEGPTMFRFNNEDKWCAMIDEYTGSSRGYIPFISSNIDQANSFNLADDGTYLMPTGAKHGTIIPITQKEHDALIEKWAVKASIPGPSEDAIAKYTFDGWSGASTVSDESGAQQDATLFGAATVIDDPEKGKVLYLDGTPNCYMSLPKGLFNGMDNFTISMDVKPQSTETYHFVLALGQDNYKYAFLRIRSNEARFAITTESYHDEQEVISSGSFLNQWMNVKIVKEGHLTQLYINNELVDENDCMRTISDLGSKLNAYIGKSFYTSDPYFKGCFDNIIIYNRSLSVDDFPTNIQSVPGKGDGIEIFQDTSFSEIEIRLNSRAYEKVMVTMFSANGRTVKEKQFLHPEDTVNIQTQNLKMGVYVLKVSADGKWYNFKVLIN